MRSRSNVIILFFALAFIVAGCEKLEIPELEGEDSTQKESPSDSKEDEDSDGSSNSGDEDDKYQGWGSLENQINKGGTKSKPYRAKDLAKGEFGEWVVDNAVESMPNCWVEGYIVGYVSGTSMKSAQLFKTGSKETNIIIASDTINIEASDCVPIGLSTGSSYIDTRKALNLKDNPDILKRKVKILGSICKYMGVAGLKNARDFKFTDVK